MIKIKHVMLWLEWYDYRIHRGVAQVARECGWQLICTKDTTASQDFLRAWKGDGCIALLQSNDSLQHFRDHRIPLVDLGLGKHTLEVSRVVTDNRAIGRLAAEHFRDHGYREVFVLNHDNVPMYRERFEALRDSMIADGGSVCLLNSTARTQHSIIPELEGIARLVVLGKRV